MTVYLGLFLSALLAATIIPFYSELAVGAAIAAGQSPTGVWLAASLGNTTGAIINGVLGRFLSHPAVRKRVGVDQRHFLRAQGWFSRWGVWSLLMSWLPIGGDALTVVAGALRVRWPIFISLVFIGKAARYAVLIWLVQAADPTG